MALPPDYFGKHIAPLDGLESPSQAQDDIRTLAAAVSLLEELADALALQRIKGLDEDWTPSQAGRAKARYAGLRQAVIDAGRALPAP